MSSGNHGQSLETTVAQVVADRLGVDVDDVTVIQGDTASAPFGPGTGGSRSAVILSGAAELGRRAGARQGAGDRRPPPRGGGRRTWRSRRGRISVVGTPTKATSITEVARLAYLNPAGLPPGMEMGLEEKARYTPTAPFTWSNSCHACVCEVDPRTGEVTHPALRRQRGLRRDDQPRHRRGPDRRRRGAGHRRRALRAHGLRRRRQPADDDVRRLPAAHRGRGAGRSSTATSRRRPPPTPAATRGWGRAGPSARRRR